MPLSDFQVEKETVHFKGGSFEVRGVSVSDLSVLVRSHASQMETVFATALRVHAGEVQNSEYAKLAMDLLQDAPTFIGTLIANQADEADQFANVMILPMPVQLDAIEKIAKLTFEEYGGAGKFAGSLVSVLAGMQPSMGLPTN